MAGLLLAGRIKGGGYVKCDPDEKPDPIAQHQHQLLYRQIDLQ
jgi:hypothetical protein